MSKAIRVLLVEDSEADALLMLNELKRAGFDAIAERVESAAEMEAMLDCQTWDIVLGDYSLPGFGGIKALKLLQARGLDTPFISVSGMVGEEVVVETMKAGASDYVLKDRMTRLPSAIERELKAAEERRQRRRAEAEAAHLAAIVQSSDDAIFSTTPDGVIASWNGGAEKMFGFAVADVVGHPATMLQPPGNRNGLRGIPELIATGERLARLESHCRRKDGKGIEVAIAVSAIHDSRGQVTGVSFIARDVTEAKRAEQERLQLIAELTETLAKVHALGGLLPICASCKKIRNDEGYWEQVETYIRNHSSADFTHSICPECTERLYPELHLRLHEKGVVTGQPPAPGA